MTGGACVRPPRVTPLRGVAMPATGAARIHAADASSGEPPGRRLVTTHGTIAVLSPGRLRPSGSPGAISRTVRGNPGRGDPAMRADRSRWVVVVQGDRPAAYETLRRTFARSALVEVVVDRREAPG